MPKPHEQDYIRVRNIAINDDSIETDIVRVPRTLIDSEGRETAGYYEEIEDSWDNSKGFRVRWGGKPHIIKPGESKAMPRFLAEHWADKLADHMLLRMGKKLNDKVARKQLLNKILEEVESFYEEDTRDEGDILSAEMLEYERNQKGRIRERELEIDNDVTHFMGRTEEPENDDLIDLSSIPEPMDMPPVSSAQADGKKVAKLNDQINPPTKAELIAECTALEIELTGKETIPQLIQKIKQFA